MQQLKQLQNLLQLKKVPDYYRRGGEIKNSLILLVVIAITLILNMFGVCYPVTVLLLGIAAPMFAKMHKQHIVFESYFPILAVILWSRLFTRGFMTVDGIIFVCLWHPNIMWSERIAKYILEGMRRHNLGPQTVGYKIGQKIDRAIY